MKLIICLIALLSLSCTKNTEAPKKWTKWVSSNKARYQEKISVPSAVQFLYLKKEQPLFYLNKINDTFKVSDQMKQSEDAVYKLNFQKEEILNSENKKVGSSKNPIQINKDVYFKVVFIQKENKARVFLYDLNKKDLNKKRKRTFFTYNESLKKTAVYKKLNKAVSVKFQRFDGSNEEFNKVGTLTLNNDASFSVFSESGEQPKYVMLMFRDLTNGDSTYGAGRYLIVDLPTAPNELKSGDKIEVDFNYTFNPPCAVSKGFHCPMAQDFANFKIKGGEKYLL